MRRRCSLHPSQKNAVSSSGAGLGSSTVALAILGSLPVRSRPAGSGDGRWDTTQATTTPALWTGCPALTRADMLGEGVGCRCHGDSSGGHMTDELTWAPAWQI